jgi:arylsulfatase A-like enzyme
MSVAVAQQKGKRPNVVILLADDLGWKDVGYEGSPIQTPNIDRLASQGVRFTQFYACPLCTPSRAALLTGRSPMRYGLVYSVIRPWSAYGLPQDEHVMAETFRGLGYQTAMVGKWHLGHANRQMLPNARGFDHFYGHVNAEIDYFKHTHQFYGGIDWQRNGVSVREEGYSTDLLGAEAVRVIEGRNREKPLFLYVPFNAPHGPVQPPPGLTAKYAKIANERRRDYCAVVDRLDTAIGNILGALDREKMAQDTIVLFYSDNGGAGAANNKPLRDGKMSCYEGGIRVPAVMRWPGKVKAESKSTQVMSSLDIFPTLAAAIDAKPGNTKPLDGENLWPHIVDGSTVRRGSIFWASKQNELPNYQFGVRRGEWKMVRRAVESKVTSEELFNLDEDPNEANDLTGKNPAIARELAREIDEWKALHPRCDIDSSMKPHPGWIAPDDYAKAAV